jgi:glyoxylase-like metal-dependent hydrolase (beta-lactamase superfamily II)
MKIVTLSANNPGIYTGRTGNNTFLLIGAEPTLIDAGVGDAAHIDAIADALKSAGARDLARVIVTHVHPDHASGAPAIAARWPRARFFKMPSPLRDTRYPVSWEPLADGDLVEAGDDRLLVVHTPGHAPDHIALWHAGTRTLFSADLAVAGTTVVIPDAERGGSVRSYLESLDRVLALQPAVLLPAHGPAIYDVDRVIAHYKTHRQAREQQIVQVLGETPSTVDQLVSRLYPSIHPGLAGSARATLIAHLEKLQDERLASAGPDGIWRLSCAD